MDGYFNFHRDCWLPTQQSCLSSFWKKNDFFSGIHSSSTWFSDKNGIVLANMDIPFLLSVTDLRRSKWSNCSLWNVRGSLLQGRRFMKMVSVHTYSSYLMQIDVLSAFDAWNLSSQFVILSWTSRGQSWHPRFNREKNENNLVLWLYYWATKLTKPVGTLQAKAGYPSACVRWS